MADLADHLTVGLLPWLSLDRRVRFAGYTLEPLSVVGPQLEPEIAATLAAIGSTFVQPDGSVDPVLLWPTEEGSLPMFGKPDVETAHAAVRLLAAVGVSSNEYFSWSTPVTATS